MALLGERRKSETAGLGVRRRHHHYLSAEISNTAHCFAGYIDGQPVAFLAYRHFQHPRVRNMKMEHRLVVLPDLQGLSIGARMSEVSIQQGSRSSRS
ncbi:GNAT family N-acetyltransferase [Nonomuraea sp. 10N515B]|uniref:GNAT family N-acetyltransferase n=1 Tax=Nonomuraea sp. 10N515B TaxID=3457422 RepID=UPI003FCD4CF9